MAAVLYVRGTRARQLPVFDASAPAYASAEFRIERIVDGRPEVVVARANADATAFELVRDDDTGPWVVADGDVGFEQRDGRWLAVDPAEASAAAGGVDVMLRVTVFADYVPADAREFATVRRAGDVRVGDRSLTRQEIEVDLAAFHRADDEAAADWVRRLGLDDGVVGGDAAGPARFALSFDSDGVVWQAEPIGDGVTIPARRELVTYGAEQFEVEPPSSYYDALAGISVVEGQRLDCYRERRWLEFAVQRFERELGRPPTGEDELVPTYLAQPLVGADLDPDGRAVEATVCV